MQVLPQIIQAISFLASQPYIYEIIDPIIKFYLEGLQQFLKQQKIVIDDLPQNKVLNKQGSANCPEAQYCQKQLQQHMRYDPLRGKVLSSLISEFKQRRIEQNKSADCAYCIRKIKQSNYKKLVSSWQKSRQKWTDKQFTKEKNDKWLGPEISKTQSNEITWQRLSQRIPENKIKFISNAITPSDILQGQNRSCYYLAAIAAIAENPNRIARLFPNLQINANGIYMAMLTHNGIIKEVVVDDLVPYRDGKPLYSKPAEGVEIWVMILEKCWAKLHGSYQAIQWGYAHQALNAFTSAPVFQQIIPNKDNLKLLNRQLTQSQINSQLQTLWKSLITQRKNNGILCCGTQQISSQTGLVPGHAYSILNLIEDQERNKKLVKLRNPYGSLQWRGFPEKYREYWARVPEDVRNRYGYQEDDDGVFIMFWEDFTQFFTTLQICKYRDNASYFSEQFTIDHKKGNTFQFHLSSPGHLTLGLTQSTLRGRYPNNSTNNFLYENLQLFCGRLPNNPESPNQFIKQKKEETQMQFCFMELEVWAQGAKRLEVGDVPVGGYVVYVMVRGRQADVGRATVSLYTDARIDSFEQTYGKYRYNFPEQFLPNN